MSAVETSTTQPVLPLTIKNDRTISRLDFSKLTSGDPGERAELCYSLVDALCNEGFVTLRNHGITKEQIDQVFAWNKSFFDLPLEAKNRAAHPKQPNPHRGYSYVGQEKLSKVKDFEKGERHAIEVHDIKESFDQGPTDDALYPNRWPDQQAIPGFRAFMESFYVTCHNVHLDILHALALGLGLPETYLQDLCRDNTSELRLNHYPACSASQIRAGAMRISEHTDFGTVTLLFQDSVGGLEIEDQQRRGNYFPVPAENKYDLIVNIGDCLQRWTNDKFRSTSHRVTMPPVVVGEWLDDRYSVAYFAKPSRDQSVGPLREFVKDGEAKYDDITAWEYNQQKLTRTY